MRFGDRDAGPRPIGAVLLRDLRQRTYGHVARCARCGASSEDGGWRVDPGDPKGGIVCANRFDETGLLVSCYEELERKESQRLAGVVAETKSTVRRVKESGVMGDREREFLLSIPEGYKTVEALEAVIAAKRGNGGRRGHEP